MKLIEIYQQSNCVFHSTLVLNHMIHTTMHRVDFLYVLGGRTHA
jgi:hypothetical protein